MIELPPARCERIDPVVAVRVRREVRAAVAEDVRPEEAVHEEVSGREVLHRDTVGLDHVDAVRQLEVALEDRVVAVHAADREVRGGDDDGLAVDARGDQDEAAGLGPVDGLLDRRDVLGDANGALGPGRDRIGRLLRLRPRARRHEQRGERHDGREAAHRAGP